MEEQKVEETTPEKTSDEVLDPSQICPNCASVMHKIMLEGEEWWECPEGDYLYPVNG